MKFSVTRLVAAFALLVFTGCVDNAEPEPATADSEAEHGDGDAGHAHAHPTEGPHGGTLIELGNEEYHAELVHEEAGEGVTVYVLDGAAAKQVPIAATEITINVTHDGVPRQFALAASADDGDPAGKSSRFVSEDEDLGGHLDEEGGTARLVLTIAGKSYRGKIDHDHDHDHDHEGHDH